MEMRILPVLISMERRGVCLDKSKQDKLGRVLCKQLKGLHEKANEMAGKVFNLSLSKHVRTVLYEELKLDLKSGTMVGKPAGGCSGQVGHLTPLKGRLLA